MIDHRTLSIRMDMLSEHDWNHYRGLANHYFDVKGDNTDRLINNQKRFEDENSVDGPVHDTHGVRMY